MEDIGSGFDRIGASNLRHRVILEDCVENFNRFCVEEDPIIAVEWLRNAISLLNKTTGHVDTERVLDSLFQRFCIGK